MAKKNRAWSGRFKHETDKRFLEFSQSISYDRRLALYDVAAGIAHVEMLAGKGIIPRKHAARILRGLKKIAQEFFAGKFKLKLECEDIHMNIESRLFELAGEVAGKLHTGRSRNDLVLTDLRLWLKDALCEVISLDKRLVEALALKAGHSLAIIMPGFTHTREAQPILFSHWLLAYAQMFVRDGHRLMEVYDHADISPLGSGALAGSNFPLDRELAARRLGFAGVTANSLDAVSDRDFVLEFLFAASVLMMHLSRLAEELVWFSGEGYGFFELPEPLCTGSSIMPNKKNPDAAELLRGKTGRVYGHLVSLLTVMKGTPLAYNRDFQEDKEPLFDSADTVRDCLAIAELLVRDQAGPGPDERGLRKRLHARHRPGRLPGQERPRFPPGAPRRRRPGQILRTAREKIPGLGARGVQGLKPAFCPRRLPPAFRGKISGGQRRHRRHRSRPSQETNRQAQGFAQGMG